MDTVELNSVPVRKQRVVAQAVGDEIVLILPDQGMVKVLNDTGSRIWEWIDGKATVGEIAVQLHQAFEVDLEQAKEDVWEFVHELKLKDLIGVVGGDTITAYGK